MVDTPNQNEASINTTIDTTMDTERQAIRSGIIAARKALSASQLSKAEKKLQQILKPFIDSKMIESAFVDSEKTADPEIKIKRIAGYNAINGEISVSSTLKYAQQKGIETYLPIMRGESLAFAAFDSNTRFVKKQYGILEPDVAESDWLKPTELDLVLVPLVAFDKQCNRMGMGGGFYDRSFAIRQQQAAPPLLVGVAHALQQQDNVHAQWWDVPLDFIATDDALISHP